MNPSMDSPIPIISAISAWLAPAATAVCIWFLVRFVNRDDKFKDEIFKDLIAIKLELTGLKTTLDSTKKSADALKSAFEAIEKNMTHVASAIEQTEKQILGNQKSLSMAAQLLKRHHDEIHSIKTTLHEISDNLYRVSEKKKS